MSPYVPVSKFTQKMRLFDVSCNNVFRAAGIMLELLDWRGSTDCEERMCTLLFCGYRLFDLFRLVKETHETRMQIICDEHCGCFRQLIGDTHVQIDKAEYFIHEAEELFQYILENKAQMLDNGKRRLIANFKDFAKWTGELLADRQLIARTSELCGMLHIRCTPDVLDTPVEGFRQQFYTVLCCLTILGVPAHCGRGAEDFVVLYNNSLDGFRKSDYWKSIRKEFMSWIDEGLKTNTNGTAKEHLAFLKEQWRELRMKTRAYLNSFGITYCGISQADSRGQLGKDLYWHLNFVPDEDGEPVEEASLMSNNELCRYFVMEAKIQVLDEEIERLRRGPEAHWPNNGYFRDNAPLDQIREAIYDTIKKKEDTGKYILCAQAHWIAVQKVLESKELTCGSQKEFEQLMRQWFPDAPHPCNYDSLKNVRPDDVRTRPYPEWDKAGHTNYPYHRVAMTLIGCLREQKVID